MTAHNSDTIAARVRGYTTQLAQSSGVAQQIRQVHSVLGSMADDPISCSAYSLNNTGVPVQYVVSSRRPHGLRVITEATVSETASGSERLSAALSRMARIAQQLGVPKAVDEACRIGHHLLPVDPKILDSRPSSWVYVAMGFAPPSTTRFSVYYDVHWGTPRDEWRRLANLLALTGCGAALGAWSTLVPRLMAIAQPAGAAVDIDSTGVTASKVYLRTNSGRRHALIRAIAAALPGADTEPLAHFIEMLCGNRPDATVIVHLSTRPQTTGFLASKVDICAHCLDRGDLELRQLIERFAGQHAIDYDNYPAALDILCDGTPSESKAEVHAYLGLCLRPGHGPRLNTYLRPSL